MDTTRWTSSSNHDISAAAQIILQHQLLEQLAHAVGVPIQRRLTIGQTPFTEDMFPYKLTSVCTSLL
jgi:hypothetical protein